MSATFDITGKLVAKFDPQEFGEKKFKTREFVIETAEEVNGNIYTNFAKMQLVQAKCEIIDKYNVGQIIKVSFNIRGRSYVDKKDGSTKYISNLDAWRVESATDGATTNAPAQHSNAPAYGGNSSAPPAFGSAPNFNPSPETIDDLPF